MGRHDREQRIMPSNPLYDEINKDANTIVILKNPHMFHWSGGDHGSPGHYLEPERREAISRYETHMEELFDQIPFSDFMAKNKTLDLLPDDPLQKSDRIDPDSLPPFFGLQTPPEL